MLPKSNRLLLLAGTYTLVQAQIQLVMSLIAIAQYYCVINFLRTYSLLIFIRILYFHNPSSCGGDINIGESIDGMANQAYVYLSSTPYTVMRTFIISGISLGLSVLWMLGSILLIKGGYRQYHSNHTYYWPWLSVTALVTLLDICGAIVCFDDSSHTRTLNDILQFVRGTASGLGNANPNTAWASWVMVAVYGRFGIFLAINIGLIVSTILDCNRFRTLVTNSELERNNTSPASSRTKPVSAAGSEGGTSSSPSNTLPKIPRPGLSQSFRSMKDLLFRRTNSSDSANGRNRNRVNFVPEEVGSAPIQIPQSFENLIAEQQRRLNGAGVDTSGRLLATPVATSLPLLNTNVPETSRGPARQPAGQMPWAYIAGAPTNRMRDQLPPDEDLPPVPLPDYTALQSARKALELSRSSGSIESELSYPEEGVCELKVLSSGIKAGRCVVLEAEPTSAKAKPSTHVAPQDNLHGRNNVTYTTVYTDTKPAQSNETSEPGISVCDSSTSSSSDRICVPKSNSDHSDDSSTLSLTPPLPVRGVLPLPMRLRRPPPSPEPDMSKKKIPFKEKSVFLLGPDVLNAIFPRPIRSDLMPIYKEKVAHAHLMAHTHALGYVTSNPMHDTLPARGAIGIVATETSTQKRKIINFLTSCFPCGSSKQHMI